MRASWLWIGTSCGKIDWVGIYIKDRIVLMSATSTVNESTGNICENRKRETGCQDGTLQLLVGGDLVL